MAAPVCPEDYTCAFNPPDPPDVPFQGPWWEGAWGIAVGAFAVVCLTIVLVVMVLVWKDARDARLEREYQERMEKDKREHERFIEEQRTMQLDAAKGDPEMLKLVRGGR